MSWHYSQTSSIFVHHEKVQGMRRRVFAQQKGASLLLKVVCVGSEGGHEEGDEVWAEAKLEIQKADRPAWICACIRKVASVLQWSVDDAGAPNGYGIGSPAIASFVGACASQEWHTERQQAGELGIDESIRTLVEAWKRTEPTEGRTWALCVNLPCSPELEEASWVDTCLDGAPSALLNLLPTQDRSCLPDNGTECSHDSPFGMTLQHSTGTHGEVELMWFQAGSPVRTYRSLERERDLAESEADCGPKWPGSLAKFNPGSRSWRTAQCSLLGGLVLFLETWPRWGMMRNGESWGRETPDFLTNESGFSFSLPTPCAHEGLGTSTKRFRGSPHYRGAKTAEALRTSSSDAQYTHPRFADLIMGFPIGWSALEPLGMPKYLEWYASHGIPFTNASKTDKAA